MRNISGHRENKISGNKGGFTLLETLLVVAIVAVLLGLSIIGVIAIQKELRQRELDSKAEIIYMAAQNRLTELTASGRADLYTPDETDSKGSTGSTETAAIAPLNLIPCDSTDSKRTDKDLYYVSSSVDQIAAVILPESRVEKELRDNNWVVEYDPASGSVYAVFYSEKDMEYTPDSFDTLRDKKQRKKAGAWVGYYGGDAVANIVTDDLDPKMEIYNEETLHAVISCNRLVEGKVTFTVKIKDSFGNEATEEVETAKLVSKGTRLTYDLVLDKMNETESENNRFKEKYPDLVAGSDITITVTAKSDSDLVDNKSVEGKTNSLFAEIRNSNNTSEDDNKDTAVITYCRHLQNLDKGSGINEEGKNNKKINITRGVQENNLHFENDEDNIDDWYSLYGSGTYTAVTNDDLVSYTGKFTGENDETLNTVIYGLDTKTGLFGTFSGDSLTDVTLSGAKITGGTHAGALAGNIKPKTSVVISGCKVYLSRTEGDLTGKDETNKWITGNSETGYIGGLVGYTDGNVTIKESFAATVAGKEKAGTTGGLVGYATGTLDLQESYADCYLYGSKVGGLIGAAADGKTTINVESCYSVGYIYAGNTAAGFVAETVGTMKDSYSACAYMPYEGEDKYADKIYAISSGYKTEVSDVYYLGDGHITENTDFVKSKSYNEMSNKLKFIDDLGGSNGSFTSETGGDNTSAYNLMNQGLTDYSFPRLTKLQHYGDWKADFESGTPVYYEDYEGGGCGVYGANLNTLEDTKTVLGDGYGIIYDGTPNADVTVKYGDGKNETVTLKTGDAVNISAAGANGYWLLKFPKEVVNTTYASADFYQEIVIDEVSYYYNPHFAKTVTTSKPNTVSDVYVRTARQLYSMSLYYQTYADRTAGSTYWQELDIDYGTYDWTNYYKSGEAVDTQSPIGVNGEKPFKATYTGMCNIIKGVSFVASENYYAGMFGYNKGKLQNIVIANDYDGTTNRFVKVTKNIEGSKAKARVGVLCGMNTRTITNCAVAGYTFNLKAYQSSELFAGGLVGGNSGTVKKCSSDCPVMQVSETYATMGVGGFTGRNTGHISECYSIGRVKIAEAKGDTVASAAGFAGENTGGLSKTYCAVAITISGNAKGYGFAPAGGNVTDSYYLNNGSYYYVGELSAYKIDAGDTRAKGKTATELKNLAGENKVGEVGKEANSLYHGKTTEEDIYQYPAVVTRNGEYIHYGNWPVETQLGDVGVFYWEYEEGGPNAGYHFRYLGIKGDGGIGGSSLCTAHDDGGIVTDYGYGYYYKNESESESSAELTMTSFASNPAKNTTVQEELSSQVTGYTFVAYTTGNSTRDLYLNENVANGKWSLAYTKDGTTKTYEYTVCPFFANSFKLDDPALTNKVGYDGNENTPGTEGTEYDVRSAEQLQYINWNSDKKNATSFLTESGYANDYRDYPYLICAVGKSDSTTDRWTRKTTYSYSADFEEEVVKTRQQYSWNQTHDIDNQGQPDDENAGSKATNLFTPIGSMYYTTESETGSAYMAYFGGIYNGNSYAIKNIEISSDTNMVGLFGITVGAKLENIIMYSENKNNIAITNESDRWYCVGGLVGFAAEGSEENGTGRFDNGVSKATISNCTVSGYTIKDERSTSGGWGGASIGGLAGATNMDVSKCTAVNEINLELSYDAGWNNVRVGGLIGNCRATIDGCYAGGKIVSNVGCQGEDAGSHTNIWTGGLTGGIVMIEGAVKELVGLTTEKVYVKNSYSYVNLPEAGSNQIRSSYSIASNGEMQSTAFGTVTNPDMNIVNCYAYEDNVKNTDDYKNKGNKTYEGVTQIATGTYGGRKNIYITNNGKSPYVTYDQLSAASGENGNVIDLLNKDNTQFGFVTTEENGAKIDGKYSYPGDDPSLEGVNYPFPTVLTQEDTSGNTVNVHYGTWPKGSLYWADSMESFDMLDSDTITMYLNYEGTDGSSTTPAFKFLDEDGNELTDDSPVSLENCNFVTDKKHYEVIFNLLKEGTVTVQASVGDATANALISITGNLVITAEPAEIETTVNKEETLTFTVKSAKGKDLPGTTAWKVEVDDDAIASAVTSGNKVTVTGLKIGETSLTATATYTDKSGQTFTKSVVVVVTVEQADSTNNESDGTTE